MIAGNHQGGEV